jgi:hypothetical protein
MTFSKWAFVSLTLTSFTAFGGGIYTTGFESPTYTVSPINGQDGWQVFNPGSSFDSVETGFVKSGTQAASVIPVGPNQSGIYHTDTLSGSPLIDLNADLYIASSSSENSWQFAGLGGGLFPFIGGIDIDPSTPGSDLIFGITNQGGSFPILGSFSLNAWHNVDLLFNFTNQTYSVSLDGTTLASGLAFCNDNGPCTTPGTITEGSFSSFFDVFAALNTNDLGAIDNLSLSSVAVPEPATYGFTGVALLAGAFLLRRRA